MPQAGENFGLGFLAEFQGEKGVIAHFLLPEKFAFTFREIQI